MSREVLKTYISAEKPVLEIGVLDRPFLSKNQYNVFYADIYAQDELRRQYKNDIAVKKENIPSIDYVIKTSYADAVGLERFNAVFHSHVIEHTPDIIKFLQEQFDILSNNGKIVMAIPDKRYTFDHFREITPFRDAYDIFKGNSTSRLEFDFLLNSAGHENYHVDKFSFEPYAISAEKVMEAIAGYNASVDVHMHLWVFTDKSFLSFLLDGIRCKLLPFKLEYYCPTRFFSNEFYVVLKKAPELISNQDEWLNEILKLNALIENTENDIEKNFLKLISDFTNTRGMYIYGAGKFGVTMLRWCRKNKVNVKGFIVSDESHRKTDKIDGANVFVVDEIDRDENILVTVYNPSTAAEIELLLKNKAYTNVLNWNAL